MATLDMTQAVSVRGISRAYGTFRALDALDLDIARGEVFSLLGPNGAGKTTTLEILEGFRRRSSGEAQVLGTDPAKGDRAWRDRIGIVSQDTGAFDELTMREIVAHHAGFYSRPLPVDEVIELVGLTDKRDARGMQLSGGQKRRLDVALGIVGDPDLIFLDEPTTGLDPVARRQAWDLVRALTAREKTVILTTHYLDEAEALADRVGVIARGALLDVGTPQEVGGRSAAVAEISFTLSDALGAADLPRLPGRATAERNGSRVSVRSGEPSAALRVLLDWARACGVHELPDLAVARPTLEDVYLRMIADTATAPTGEQPA